MTKLTYDLLKNAVIGTGAAFRCVTEYQPAGGAGDKFFHQLTGTASML